MTKQTWQWLRGHDNDYADNFRKTLFIFPYPVQNQLYILPSHPKPLFFFSFPALNHLYVLPTHPKQLILFQCPALNQLYILSSHSKLTLTKNSTVFFFFYIYIYNNIMCHMHQKKESLIAPCQTLERVKNGIPPPSFWRQWSGLSAGRQGAYLCRVGPSLPAHNNPGNRNAGNISYKYLQPGI